MGPVRIEVEGADIEREGNRIMENRILIVVEVLHFVIAAIGAGEPIANGNHQFTSAHINISGHMASITSQTGTRTCAGDDVPESPAAKDS